MSSENPTSQCFSRQNARRPFHAYAQCSHVWVEAPGGSTRHAQAVQEKALVNLEQQPKG